MGESPTETPEPLDNVGFAFFRDLGRQRVGRPADLRARLAAQPAGSAYSAIAAKWATAAAITSTWKISWKPKVAGRGSGLWRA